MNRKTSCTLSHIIGISLIAVTALLCNAQSARAQAPSAKAKVKFLSPITYVPTAGETFYPQAKNVTYKTENTCTVSGFVANEWLRYDGTGVITDEGTIADKQLTGLFKFMPDNAGECTMITGVEGTELKPGGWRTATATTQFNITYYRGNVRSSISSATGTDTANFYNGISAVPPTPGETN